MLKILRLARQSRRTMVLLIAAAVAFCGIAGGTVAFIMARSAPVQNVFIMEGIAIDLTETPAGEGSNGENRYEMVPGALIDKDPQVTVRGGSMAAWVFVKLEKSENFDAFMTYAPAEGWLPLEDVENVYYRAVEADEEDQIFRVLEDNQVKVKDDVTVLALRALTEETFPTLTITAYAVQQAGVDAPAQAWTMAGGTEETP
ncbi:MAG: hypothetical protein E7324_05170 [Clostridiales bacterium]|nr:hypothetical protein [Clostridiales bacterium]